MLAARSLSAASGPWISTVTSATASREMVARMSCTGSFMFVRIVVENPGRNRPSVTRLAPELGATWNYSIHEMALENSHRKSGTTKVDTQQRIDSARPGIELIRFLAGDPRGQNPGKAPMAPRCAL